MKTYSNTTYLLLCALFAALTAVFSAISIPLPFTPVPLNLATLSVFLSGGLLGYKYGPLSQTVYVLLGAVGVPVFHSFTGGLGILVGPTGGYIAGYILAAFVIGFVLKKDNASNHFPLLLVAMFLGACSYFLLGTIWFMIQTGTSLMPALISCVFPFLPGDAIKLIVASLLVKKLRPVIMSKSI